VRLQPNDLIGFGVVATTLVVAFAHRSSSHREAHTEPVPVASAEGGSNASRRTVALVDVHVAGPADEEARGGQVVLVENGIVTWVGPVEDADVPADAPIVDGKGTDWVVAPDPDRRPSDFLTITPGIVADLVVVRSNPRSDPNALLSPRGTLSKGAWTPTGANRAPGLTSMPRAHASPGSG